MAEVVILSGSPSVSSGTEVVLKYMGELLIKESFSVKHISVRDVPQNDLFLGNYSCPHVQEISNYLENAHGVIVGSPVYKAAYSGVLKALVDILPQNALQDTTVLPLMTGGSPAHMLALEYTLKPLLATLKGQLLKGVYVLDNHISKHTLKPIIDEDILNRTRKQLYYFVELLNRKKIVQF